MFLPSFSVRSLFTVHFSCILNTLSIPLSVGFITDHFRSHTDDQPQSKSFAFRHFSMFLVCCPFKNPCTLVSHRFYFSFAWVCFVSFSFGVLSFASPYEKDRAFRFSSFSAYENFCWAYLTRVGVFAVVFNDNISNSVLHL